MLMRTPTRWARPKLLRPPGFIVPCRPTLAAKVPTGDDWIHELKHDGFRIIAHKDGGARHLALQVGIVHRLGEGQEPGI
jgi:hypothetical protein